MPIYKLDSRIPHIHPTAYIADEATVIGDVTLGENVSVWPGAVIRADSDPISIGKNSNVQEGAVLHADPGSPIIVGENVTIGHQAMLHGCTVEDGALIGIKAVVLNNARIGSKCLVGAGALVTEGNVFPPGAMVLGAPAKVIKMLDSASLSTMAKGVQTYVDLGRLSRERLQKLD